MDKINVLWIEDNPLQESVYVRDLIAKNPQLSTVFNEALYGEPIPAIHFNGRLIGYEKYFNLQVLQHPVENKQFISSCLKVEDLFGSAGFHQLHGVVPEVIAFDYHFGAKIAVNQGNGAMSYHPKTFPIRHFVNPNYRFFEETKLYEAIGRPTNLLELPESENYSQANFLKAISGIESTAEIREKDLKDLLDDDIGLLTAIEILRLFRQHPVVAIPSTFVKDQIVNLSLHGKYFEWLNDHDLSINFSRSGRGEKKWESVLEDGMKTLQQKLADQLKLGKISVSYDHLYALTQRKLPEERTFNFTSVYGVRCLPLDGLFFYEDERNRDSAIHSWASNLYELYAKQAGVNYNHYRDAVEESRKLIAAYESDDVDKRIRLSQLLVQEFNGELKANRNKLSVLELHFGVSEKQKSAFRNGQDARAHGITRQIADIRKVRREIARLTVLMVDIRLHLLYQRFMSLNTGVDVESRTMRVLKGRPEGRDLFFALFPVAENPLVLPYHLIFIKDLFDAKTMKAKLQQRYEAWENALDNLKLRQNGMLPASVTEAERALCRSFAQEQKLLPEYYPNWLLNNK